MIESTRIAIRGIRANRLRSMLTMLGILIGVGAVIVLVAVGSGSSAAVQEQIGQLGTNTLTVLRTPSFFGGGPEGGGATQSRRIELTEQDIDDLSNPDLAPSIAQVAYTESATGNVVWEGTSVAPDQLIGTTANYADVSNWTVAAGSFLTDNDIEQHNKVAVIGSSIATDLFGTVDPLGQTIKIDGVSFEVTGVLEAKGSNGFQDQDSVVMAPVSAVEDSLIGRNADIANLVVQAESQDVMDEAQAEIESILATNHDVTAEESPFQVLNQATLLDTSNETNRVFTVLLGAVAGISLLVGGIGVMNIMLVTVTERTREIGIRKAVGARRHHILGQFLVEAVLLTVLGGLLGVIAGLLASRFEIAGVEPVVEPYSIVVAFGVAVAIGLFFGIYPANRAATLRPIDALRYE
jgi:putative ABC transport system permease protein